MIEIYRNNMQKDIIYICEKCGIQGMWIYDNYKENCHSTSASGTLSKDISMWIPQMEISHNTSKQYTKETICMQEMWIPGNFKE